MIIGLGADPFGVELKGAHSDFVGFWWQVKDSRRVESSPLRKTNPLVLTKPDPGDAHSRVNSFPVAVERIVGRSRYAEKTQPLYGGQLLDLLHTPNLKRHGPKTADLDGRTLRALDSAIVASFLRMPQQSRITSRR